MDYHERLFRPALVIVDMQNDFVREGAPMEVPEARATIPNHLKLISYCRGADIPVVYTKFLAGPQPTLIWEWSPALKPPTKCCWKGHLRYYPDVGKELDCSDIIEEIYPEGEDLIVEKYGYGAFYNTNLEDILKAHEVESLFIAGTVSQVCVEETARGAFHRGFRTTIVSDAISSNHPDLHAATLKNFALKFGWVETTAKLLEGLRGSRSL